MKEHVPAGRMGSLRKLGTLTLRKLGILRKHYETLEQTITCEDDDDNKTIAIVADVLVPQEQHRAVATKTSALDVAKDGQGHINDYRSNRRGRASILDSQLFQSLAKEPHIAFDVTTAKEDAQVSSLAMEEDAQPSIDPQTMNNEIIEKLPHLAPFWPIERRKHCNSVTATIALLKQDLEHVKNVLEKGIVLAMAQEEQKQSRNKKKQQQQFSIASKDREPVLMADKMQADRYHYIQMAEVCFFF